MSKIDTQKIIVPIMKFVNMKGIIALKDGMLAILPLTVVGSIFLILGQLPFEGLNAAIASIFGAEWTEPFMQVYSGTFAIMGLISCFAIGYSYAKNSGVEPLPAGVLSLSSFFILLKSSYIPVDGEPIGDAIAKVWFGGQGIIGAIGIAFFISFLWWFGVHGQSVVNGVVTALLLSNLDANKALLAADKLSLENGAHIVTQQFLDSFLIMSGSGITFGIVFAMLFAAKSKQYKALGKVAAFPALFNVNEPVVFGFPIVMNPVMFLPFVLVPILAAFIVYGAISIGFMQPFSGVTLPWSTPAIISGFMVGGWQGAVVQIIILAVSTIVYFPFFKIQDKIAYESETKEPV
ncbi:TPA: PTS sugar transporter subunit IIC [Streptococcus suis]|uniref:PTS sugar transporter subunit IIC n=1 Tax=Streptococcus suis TaxID=1307 RepID=UPI002E0E63CC|nr:PTS transporter subunit EIIC [Streptococcus suis]